MSVIDPEVPEGKAGRPTCTGDHKLPKHEGEGSIVLCQRCERWRKCHGHYPSVGCISYKIGPWDFAARRKIRAYLKRRDTDGEAE